MNNEWRKDQWSWPPSGSKDQDQLEVIWGGHRLCKDKHLAKNILQWPI